VQPEEYYGIVESNRRLVEIMVAWINYKCIQIGWDYAVLHE
jgi:hypothetical protein